MKSVSQYTNSLLHVGDKIIVKTPLPINNEEIKIIGYEVITQDVIDFQDWVGGRFAISPVSTYSTANENNLEWKFLHKDKEGNCPEFIAACNELKEPFYIYFRFEKLESSGQVINITKVNLKIQDSDKIAELRAEYPYYFQSIFGDTNPNSTEILTWNYNVYDKVAGDAILPHYIAKDRDFSIFWGWITHFFAIIVHFGRKFKNIFDKDNFLANIDIIGEFFKQKDYIKDSRVAINENLKICLSEELVQKLIPNTKIGVDGYPIYANGYIFSGYLPIQNNNILILKIGGYNKNIDNFDGLSVSITLAYYYNSYQLVQKTESVTLSKTESIIGKRIQVPEISNNEQIRFVGLSYAILTKNGKKLPYFIQVFVEGNGSYLLENRDRKEIYNIYKDFRKRGTQSVNQLIKKVFETRKEDGFHADYIGKRNIGWFLNRNCPINNNLIEEINIDSLVVKKQVLMANGLYVEYADQYIILNQNTIFNLKWKVGEEITREVFLDVAICDKNGNELSDRILGNWKDINGNLNNPTLVISDFEPRGIRLIPTLGEDNYYSTKMLISLIDSTDKAKFGEFYQYGKNSLVKDNLYLFAKHTNLENPDDEDSYYLKIKGAVFIVRDSADNTDFVIGQAIYLSKFNNISDGFITLNSSSVTLTLEPEYGSNITKIISNISYHKGINEFRFIEEGIDYGCILVKDIPDNFPKTVHLKNLKSELTYKSVISDNNIVNLESHINLRRLPVSLGFLNNQQYYLCCFRNNGAYSNEEAAEIIDKKILPYNGKRLFIDNTSYKNDINVPLTLRNITFSGGLNESDTTKDINIEVKGGVLPYKFMIDGSSVHYSFIFNGATKCKTSINASTGEPQGDILSIRTTKRIKKYNISGLNFEQVKITVPKGGNGISCSVFDASNVCIFRGNNLTPNISNTTIIPSNILTQGKILYVYTDGVSGSRVKNRSNIISDNNGGTTNVEFWSYNDNFIYKELTFGSHIFKIVDAIGEELITDVSCQPFNKLNCRLRIFIDIDNKLECYVNVSGGLNKSYTVTYRYQGGSGVREYVIASNTWTLLPYCNDIKCLIGWHYQGGQQMQYFFDGIDIKDNDSNFILHVDTKTLIQDKGIQFYDTEEGEIIEN